VEKGVGSTGRFEGTVGMLLAPDPVEKDFEVGPVEPPDEGSPMSIEAQEEAVDWPLPDPQVGRRWMASVHMQRERVYAVGDALCELIKSGGLCGRAGAERDKGKGEPDEDEREVFHVMPDGALVGCGHGGHRARARTRCE
jgi:hypothetical protein